MKKMLMMAAVLGLGLGLASAQNGGGYIKPGPIGQSPTPSCPTKSRSPLPIDCWVGQKIIIIPKGEARQYLGYPTITPIGNPRGDVPYSELGGMTGVISAVKKSPYGKGVATIKIDSTGREYEADLDSGANEAIAFKRDLDDAKKALLNKPLWMYSEYMNTVNAYGNVSFLELTRFSKVTVQDVRLSNDGGAFSHPIRVVFKTQNGKTGYRDIGWSGTNADPGDSKKFEDVFFDSNPRSLYKWPESVWKKLEKHQVSIGMNKAMVLLSQGRPDKVNKTSFQSRMMEQWVYPASFLYFEGEFLKVIQN